jgi:ankyrin repeat protein
VGILFRINSLNSWYSPSSPRPYPLLSPLRSHHTSTCPSPPPPPPTPLQVGIENNRGQTPLHIAARQGEDRICSILLDHGADSGAGDKKMRTALHYAALKGVLILCGGIPPLPTTQPLLTTTHPLHATPTTHTDTEVTSVLGGQENAHRSTVRRIQGVLCVAGPCTSFTTAVSHCLSFTYVPHRKCGCVGCPCEAES